MWNTHKQKRLNADDVIQSYICNSHQHHASVSVTSHMDRQLLEFEHKANIRWIFADKADFQMLFWYNPYTEIVGSYT